MESPLDPMNQYSNIPPGYDANILYEIIKEEIKKWLDEQELSEIEIP